MLSVKMIQKPNRFFAFPVFGGLVKVIILIPQFVELLILLLIDLILAVVNSLAVLFTGSYLEFVYQYNVNLFTLIAKVTFYFSGLSDTYPGLDFNPTNDFTLKCTYPKNPNRLFAIPLFGGIARGIMLIPYGFFQQVMQNGSWVGTMISSFPVLFNGKYPESTYEFNSDSMRVFLASFIYGLGISDSYPSFKISMNHKNIKITLIVIGSIMSLFRLNFGNGVHAGRPVTHPYLTPPV